MAINFPEYYYRLVSNQTVNRAKFILRNIDKIETITNNTHSNQSVYEVSLSAYFIVRNYENPMLMYPKWLAMWNPFAAIRIARHLIPDWCTQVNKFWDARDTYIKSKYPRYYSKLR